MAGCGQGLVLMPGFCAREKAKDPADKIASVPRQMGTWILTNFVARPPQLGGSSILLWYMMTSFYGPRGDDKYFVG